MVPRNNRMTQHHNPHRFSSSLRKCFPLFDVPGTLVGVFLAGWGWLGKLQMVRWFAAHASVCRRITAAGSATRINILVRTFAVVPLVYGVIVVVRLQQRIMYVVPGYTKYATT